MSDEFCTGMLAGMLLAGVVGFVMQQMRLAYKGMKQAGQPQRIITETSKSPWQVFWDSVRSAFVLLLWFLVIIVLIWTGFELLS